MVNIKYGLFDIANLMAKQIYGYHWQGMACILHILRIGVVNAQILAKA